MGRDRLSKQGQRHRDFVEAYGLALLNWQHIEAVLFNVFTALSQVSDVRISAAIFFSVNTVHARTKLCDEVAKVVLEERGPELLAEWLAVSKKVRQEAAARNAIAHGLPSPLRREGDEPDLWVPAVARHDGEQLLRDPDHWDADRIRAAIDRFVELELEVGRLSRRLFDTLGHHC